MATKPGRKPSNSVDALSADEQVQFYGRRGVMLSQNLAGAEQVKRFMEFIAEDEERFDALLVEWIKSERA
jgi:hypothetical protein